MSLCASIYMCFVVTCWERADLLAVVCGVCCEFVTFPLVSWVRCGTWLYRFLIFAPLLILIKNAFQCLKLPTIHQQFVATTQYERATYCLWVTTSLNVALCILFEISLTEKMKGGVICLPFICKHKKTLVKTIRCNLKRLRPKWNICVVPVAYQQNLG